MDGSAVGGADGRLDAAIEGQGADDAADEEVAAVGAAGTGGATGTADAGGTEAPTSPSLGCNMMPPSTDSTRSFVKHDITVSGVDPAFIAQFPINAGAQYDWTHRNYFVRLPTGYDVTRPYPIVIGGSDCGGSETVGAQGGDSVLGVAPGETQAIQVSMSYVASNAANPSACLGFADDFPNSPEPAYVDALIADVESKLCVDKSKIFVSGKGWGGFQSILSGCANSNTIRGFGVQIGGGLQRHRPPCENHGVAAIFVVGLRDTYTPIGPLTTPQDDNSGSAPARDDILERNGCADKTTTAMWDPMFPECVKYTSCPDEFPVVWCALDSGGLPDPNDSAVNLYLYNTIWKFYSTLPSP